MRSITLPAWQFDRQHSRDSVPRALLPEAIRSRMVDRDLRSWSRARSSPLLGEPTRTDYSKAFDLVYELGPERGSVSIDSQWLHRS
jgi:hypothetical protein